MPADGCVQSRPRHPAGNPDRACRADARGCGRSASSAADHTGRLRSMMSAAPLSSNSRPTARPSSRGRSAGRSRGLDDQAAGQVQHRCGQRHPRALDARQSRDRRIAMAIEHPQHLALGLGAWSRRGRRSETTAAASANRRPHTRPRRCLARGRQHFRDRKFIGDTTAEADTLEPGARHDQRIAGPTTPPSGNRCNSRWSSLRIRVSAAPR